MTPDAAVDRKLAAAFRIALQLDREQRDAGASAADRWRALENILRANWPAPPDDAWPAWARVPRCARCNGYGLIITVERNRLGYLVDVGRPCPCPKGARYERPAPAAAAAAPDFTAAGKTPPKSRTLSRW